MRNTGRHIQIKFTVRSRIPKLLVYWKIICYLFFSVVFLLANFPPKNKNWVFSGFLFYGNCLSMVYRLLAVNFSPSNPSPSPCFIFLPEPAKLSLTTLVLLILKLSLRKTTIAHKLPHSNYNPVHGDSRLINNRV